MFSHLTLRTRLALIVLAALAGMLLLASISAVQSRSRLMEDKKMLIRYGTQGVFNAVMHLQKQENEGKLTREEAQRLAKEIILNARYGGVDGKTEYYYAWTSEGVGVVHIKRELEGRPMVEKLKDSKGRYTLKDMQAVLSTAPEGFLDAEFPRPGGTEAVPKLLFVMAVPNWNWMLGTGIYIDDVDADFRKNLLQSSLEALGLALLIGLLGFLIARSVLLQIGGEPRMANEIMQRVADGDLTAQLDNMPKGSLLHSLGNMVGSLHRMISSINSDAAKLVANAEHIARASDEVTQAAEQQTDSTSSMAAAVEELTVSSNHISDSAHETARETSEAAELAAQGSARVLQASTAIEKIASTVSDASGRIHALEERARQVSTIASVIKDIAGQTNLLALNAAIEAARAGEQGRGFAVVADEVRKLAERTSSATLEIEQMISGIQADTIGAVEAMNAALPEVQEGVQLASSASDSLLAIENSSRRTLERVGEVADATREQSSASTSIAQRVEQIANMVEETTATIRGTTQSAHELETIAGNLRELVGRFKT
ncbi:methyl-accepting chemotaxis protein [Dechloromonas sp. CZR5]|uniref:methyl-accepting chemotaxis protein n=1 Tax=Dechloromonas sp. CZR5 TaxID=2608630 RepID=UPI00123D9FE4|nr:methyl-accepting chemotaxis protein [Dechloromonas sp. CZR5]